MFNGNIRYILRNLGKRHRISVTDEAGNTAAYSGAQLLGEGLPITLAASPASTLYFFEPVTC